MIDRGIIVSCQAETGSAFDNVSGIVSFASEAKRGGAVGLRIKDSLNIRQVRGTTALPIIGLTKSYYESGAVLITPNYDDIVELHEAGADYVAVDATGRNKYDHIIEARNSLDIKIIGDLSDIHEADQAIKCGCTMLTTALSGYTEVSQHTNEWGPDFALLSELVTNFDVPILAEGRYWSPDQVKRAIDLGATAVVIGSAITRPHKITEYFTHAYKRD